MRPAVDAWLRERGCVPVHETHLRHRCDVIGVQFANRVGRSIPDVVLAVAVELKLTDVAGVIRQAGENLHYVHESYAAMPAERCDVMRPATLQKFADWGVGLLAVSPEEVQVLIRSGRGSWQNRLQQKLWRRVRAADAAKEEE